MKVGLNFNSEYDHKGAGNWQELFAHLLIAVPDDWQIEELASMLLGQYRVNAGSMWASQLLVGCQIIRCWCERVLA